MATPTTLPAAFVAGNVLTAAQLNDLRGAFRVLQVVSTTKTDTFSSASASFVDITGLSVTVTPSSATSQILVMVQLSASSQVGTGVMYARLVRDSTAIDVGTSTGNRIPALAFVRGLAADAQLTVPATFLDSPATTAATTYKMQGRVESAGSFFVNRSTTDTDNSQYVRTASTITVMEISA
jgi:hypothetical protein